MGQTFEVEPVYGSRVGSVTSANGAPVPPRPAESSDGDERALIAGYLDELDDMRARVSDFPNQDPSDVLATIAGVAGRLSEIRARLYRSNSPRCSALRTREVDPLREDLELQFRIWSRRIALMEWELKLSGGAT